LPAAAIGAINPCRRPRASRFIPEIGGTRAVAHWVDYLILAVLVLAALHGWRTGAIRQVLAFGGLWVGLVVGVVAAPTIARHFAPTSAGLVALAVVVAAVAVCGAIGQVAGWRVASVVRSVRLGVVDDALGVAVAVAAMLLAVWFVGTLAAASRSSTLDQGLRNSAILQQLTRSLPTVPSVFARIESVLASQGLPIVFATLPPQLLAPAPQPASGTVRAVRDVAGPSTVKVLGPACGGIVEGSGFVAARGIVVTNAHVVGGDPSPRVVDGSGTYAATVILFDSKLDVAVLRVPGLADRPLPVDTATAARGVKAVALGYPEGGPLTAIPAAVDGTFMATGLDIYGNSFVSRSVYQLHAVVRPGNSGGPLVARETDGPRVIGLVFARSTADPSVGYALAMGPVAHDIRLAEATDTAVATGGCAG
jgi:S1-C subfamily serine protease